MIFYVIYSLGIRKVNREFSQEMDAKISYWRLCFEMIFNLVAKVDELKSHRVGCGSGFQVIAILWLEL